MEEKKKQAIIQFKVDEDIYWRISEMKGLGTSWYDFLIKPILEKEKRK